MPSVPAAAEGPVGSPSQSVWSDTMATDRSLARLGEVVGLPLPNAEAVLGADRLVAVGIGSRVAQGIVETVVRQ